MNATHAGKVIAVADRYDAALELITQGLRVLPIRGPWDAGTDNPGKQPCWDAVLDGRPLISEINDFERWLTRTKGLIGSGPFINMAIVEGQIVQVDCDTDEAIELAQRYGVDLDGAVWIVKTARGWKYFYKNPGDPRLLNRINLGGCECHPAGLDLIANSPAVCPPSIHKTGALYQWGAGHSPTDIQYRDLDDPPPEIIERWLRGYQRPHQAREVIPQSADLVEAVRASLAALSRRGLREGAGGWTSTNCPFPDHGKGRGDRGASFSVNFADAGGWICFAGCGKGSLADLAKRLGLAVATRSRSRAGVNVSIPVRGSRRGNL